MEPEKETLRPYVNERLVIAAKKGLECIGDDLVIYLDTENHKDVVVKDRNKFLSIIGSSDALKQALNEPERIKASRTMALNKDAIVFWFVVSKPSGAVTAQVITLNNQYRLTTHTIGLA